MKIYRFRALTNEIDHCRLKDILETSCFYCSKFNELNDPMEGVFISNGNDTVGDILKEKLRYKICSFSGKKGFKKPTMRCHYANSFKGVAIELEVNEQNIIPITYNNETIESGEIKDILTRKSKARKYENEYRFLIQNENNFHKIGKITCIYFGDPYHNISNRNEVTSNNENIRKYEEFKEKIIKILDKKKIKYHNVFAKNGTIKIIKN